MFMEQQSVPECYCVLCFGQDGNDPAHESKKLLPFFVVRVFPLYWYHFGRPFIDI